MLVALREAGLDEAAAARAERLTSTSVLGFAASKAAGRFRERGPLLAVITGAALSRGQMGRGTARPNMVP